MRALLRRLSGSLQAVDLVTLATIVAAYVMLFAAAPRFPPATLALLIVLGLVYALLGTYGLAYVERRGQLSLGVAYLVVQFLIGTAILFVSQISAWIIMLPVAAHSVALVPRRGVVLFSLLISAQFGLAVRYVGGSWSEVLQNALAFLAAVVFVVFFTQVTVNEGRARAESERLRLALEEANQQLRAYAAQAQELAIAQERNRLAREIHDSLGHYLTALNVQIQAAQVLLPQSPDRTLDALGKAQSLTQQALVDVRRSVATLRASPLESRSLAEALASLVEEVRAGGIVAQCQIAPEAARLDAQVELTLYRAAQEALTNVRKHARASRVDLALERTATGGVLLSIEDNGVGATRTEGGYGLLGVRERVSLLGGELRIFSTPGQGFRLEVELPA